jgi:hypothetical protein
MRNKFISLLAVAFAATLSNAASASTVYDTGLVSPPGVYFGAGKGGTNHGWTVNTNGSVELGLTTIHRGVDSVNPTSTNIYNVPTGPDGAPNRAWWNFDFSVNLNADGNGTLNLGNVTATLQIHDYLHGTTVALNPFTAFGDNSAYDGTNTRNGNVPGQQATSADVGYQNSENLTFGQFAALGFDMNVDDTFLITLSLLGPDNADLGTVNEYTVVGAGTSTTPLPAALPLFASGLSALGLLGWRRKRKAAGLAA